MAYEHPSEKAIQIYKWIYEQTMKNGFQPTLREMDEHFGYASTNALVCFFATLKKHGYIKPSGARSRALRFLKTPDGEPFRGFIHKPK